jgi:uncharacterized protein with beta-barrel porin domain
VAWTHDYDIDDREIQASILGAPGAPVSLDGQSTDRNGARIEAGVGFRRGPVSVWLDYQGGVRGDGYTNGVAGGVQWSF